MYNLVIMAATAPLWVAIVAPIVLFIFGVFFGFYLARFYVKRYLAKNPPINEAAIRAMGRQMGRTFSEKQVKQIVAQMNAANQGDVKK